MSFDPLDAFEGGDSDCCGARILMGGICFECGEHCEAQQDEDDEKPTCTRQQPGAGAGK